MVVYLGHSSPNPKLSQFIVSKLIWPSSGTFQHHHQLSTPEDTPSCLLGRLDTHQRASLCGQLEFVSRTSLIGFESCFFSTARPSGVFVERPRSLEQQSASICGGLPAWETRGLDNVVQGPPGSTIGARMCRCAYGNRGRRNEGKPRRFRSWQRGPGPTTQSARGVQRLGRAGIR